MAQAQELSVNLGGTRFGGYGTAPCLVCQPEKRADQNALTLRDGTRGLLAHCKKEGCRFGDILAAAGVGSGHRAAPDAARETERAARMDAELRKRAEQAWQCYDAARPIEGTPAETYLRAARGITYTLPPTLRFHPFSWHGPTATGHPALLARVEGGGGLLMQHV